SSCTTAHVDAVRKVGWTRSQEKSVEKRRRLESVRNAIPVKSAVEVKTFRATSRSAPPKVGSIKYFCANSQLTISRIRGILWQGFSPTGTPRSQGIGFRAPGLPTVSEGIPSGPQSSRWPELRLA